MLHWLIIVAALFDLTGPDGASEGRDGNERFREGRYAEAVTVYRQGLARTNTEPGPIRAGLFNNLGAAQYQQENYAEATQAFNDGLAAASTAEGRTRLAYNAGNSSFREEKLEEALAYYRQALLTNPNHENAKFNYEFVKRRLEEQRKQQQQQSQNDQNNEQENQQNQDQQNNQQQNNQQQNQQNQQDPQDPQDQRSQQDQQQRQQQQQNNNGSNPSDSPSSQNGQQQQARQQQDKLSRQEAMRILQALEDSEKDVLRQRPSEQQPRDRNIEKDW